MTQNNKYPSKYSNGKSVSAAQFITEIICENKALKDKKDLHYRFWTNKEWAAFYRSQIASAHKLLKQYSPKAIIKALKNSKARKIYSLRAPHLIPIIEQEQVLVEQNEGLTADYSESREINTKQFRKNKVQKGIISKLREIDDGI